MIWLLKSTLAGPCTAAVMLPTDFEDTTSYIAVAESPEEARAQAWEQACVSFDLPAATCRDELIEFYLPTFLTEEIREGGRPIYETTLLLDPVPESFEASRERKNTKRSCKAAYDAACREAGLDIECVERGDALRALLQTDEGTQVLEGASPASATLYQMAAG